MTTGARTVRADATLVDALHAAHYLILACASIGVLLVLGWRALPRQWRTKLAARVSRSVAARLENHPGLVLLTAGLSVVAAVLHVAISPGHVHDGSVGITVVHLVSTMLLAYAAAGLVLGDWPRWVSLLVGANVFAVVVTVATFVAYYAGWLGVSGRQGPTDLVAVILEVAAVTTCAFAYRQHRPQQSAAPEHASRSEPTSPAPSGSAGAAGSSG